VIGVVLLRVVQPGGGDVFRLFGELDTSNIGELDTVLRHARDGGDVVLDLADLTFVDSTGIKRFVAIAHALGDAGKLILLSPRPSVARLLECTGIAHALANIVVFPTPDPSVRAAQERRAGPAARRPSAPSTVSTVVPLEAHAAGVPSSPAQRTARAAAGESSRSGGPEELPFIWLG
jgi:anti-sigma B factor antagonist